MTTATEYCDRCNQRATTTITLPSGWTLVFCGHHTNRNRAALPAGTTFDPVTGPAAEPAPRPAGIG